MIWFYHLIGTAIALALIAGAFVYVFNPQAAEKLLKQFFIPVLVLMLLPTVVARLLGSADGFALFITFVLASLVAYVVREHRLGRPQTPRRLGRAERTPVLPRKEQEE
jgi:amino acid permease